MKLHVVVTELDDALVCDGHMEFEFVPRIGERVRIELPSFAVVLQPLVKAIIWENGRPVLSLNFNRRITGSERDLMEAFLKNSVSQSKGDLSLGISLPAGCYVEAWQDDDVTKMSGAIRPITLRIHIPGCEASVFKSRLKKLYQSLG